MVKLDALGNIQWQSTIGGNDNDELNSIQQTTDGGYILGGSSYSGISGDKTENNFDPTQSTSDYWVIKLDSSGNIQWQNTIGGIDADILSSVQQTTDGGYILGGQSVSDSSGDKSENHKGGYDYWIVKLNSAGNIQWQNTIGGMDADVLNSIVQTTDGGYILEGSSTSKNSFDKIENCLGNNDIWIVKLDAFGNIQNQKTIGGYLNDDYNWYYFNGLNSIEKTTDGGYIFGASSNSNISGDKLENSKGGFDYWIVKFNDKYNAITGKLFIDANSNQLKDSGETSVLHQQITEINTGGFSFSQNDGVYYLNVLDSGNYSVSPAPINYYTASPSTHSAYFSGVNQIDSLNDFAFQPAGVFNNLCVTITSLENFRPNMNANYMINYENVGTTALNGTVILFPDNDVTFVTSNFTPTSVTTDSVVWNIGTLAPFQTGSISVTIHVNIVPSGTLINSTVRIEPVAGDANTACNYSAWEDSTTGSYDPNAILVDRDTVLTTELSSPPYLNYIIYFQNTGNDTAFNARVLNNIPQMLDVNSFEFVASSHPVNINYGAHSRLFTFTFDNINLPDSGANEPASHGFIRYRIKPLSTLVAGDQINNNAAIYFNFNQPVLTDTAVTEIVLPTGMGEAAGGSGRRQLMIYPNPVRNELIVNSYLLNGKKGEMKIFDLYGREVFQLETSNFQLQTKIDVSHFSQGIYFVELQCGEQVLRGKFLKE